MNFTKQGQEKTSSKGMLHQLLSPIFESSSLNNQKSGRNSKTQQVFKEFPQVMSQQVDPTIYLRPQAMGSTIQSKKRTLRDIDQEEEQNHYNHKVIFKSDLSTQDDARLQILRPQSLQKESASAFSWFSLGNSKPNNQVESDAASSSTATENHTANLQTIDPSALLLSKSQISLQKSQAKDDEIGRSTDQFKACIINEYNKSEADQKLLTQGQEKLCQEIEKEEIIKLEQTKPQLQLIQHMEFHSHQIYQKHQQSQYPPEIQALTLDSHWQMSFIGQINLFVGFNQKALYTWQGTKVLQKLDNIDEISQILYLEDTSPGQKHIILVATKTELQKYNIVHGFEGRGAFHLQKEETVSLKYPATYLYQSLSTKRVFIGSQYGCLYEYDPQKVQSKRCSFLPAALDNAFSQKSKLKQVSNADINGGIYSKLHEFLSRPKESQSSKVKQIIEHEKSKSLLALVEKKKFDANGVEKVVSQINVYSISSQNYPQFKYLFKLELADVISSVYDRVILDAATQDKAYEKQLLEFKDRMTFTSVFSVSINDDQLVIVLQTGLVLTIELSVNQGDGDDIMLIPEYTVLRATLLPFNTAIAKQEGLLEEMNARADHLWHPLSNFPIKFMQSITDVRTLRQPFKILDSVQTKDQTYVFLIEQSIQIEGQDLFQNQYFVVSFKKYGSIFENNQVLRASSSQVYADIAFKFIKSEGNSLSVMTDKGIKSLVLIETKDVVCQYLDLILRYQDQSQALDPIRHKIKDILTQDFERLVSTQFPEVIQSLIQIATCNINRDSFILSNMNEHFYQNHARLNSFKQLTQTLREYIKLEDFNSARPLNFEFSKLAAEIFFQITDSSVQSQINEFYNGPSEEEQSMCSSQNSLELKRLSSLGHYMYHSILSSLIDKKIFQISKTDNKTTPIGLTNEQFSQCIFKLEQTLKFITQYRTDFLVINNISQDQIQEEDIYITMKQDYEQLSKLIKRYIDGLQLLTKISVWPKLCEIFKELFQNKDDIESIKKVTLLDYLSQGITIPQVGCLIESYVANTIDIRDFQLSSIGQTANSFLSLNTLNLIIGRKLLQEAHRLKQQRLVSQDRNNEIQCLQEKGSKLFLRSSLYVDIGTACFEMVKCFMYYDCMNLLVQKVNAIHWIQEVRPGDDAGKTMETDKQECLIMSCEFFEELHQRIQLLDQIQDQKSAQKSKRLLSRYDAINIFAEQLAKQQNSHPLQAMKIKMLEICMRCESPVFHYELYTFMYEKLGAIKDLMLVESRYAKQFIEKLNVKEDTRKSDSLLFEQRIEAAYLHYKALEDYNQIFRFLLKEMCLEKHQIDINERLSWVDKAKGCLALCRSKQRGGATEITDKELEQLSTYRSYFYLQLELKDCVLRKLKQIKQDEEEKQVLESLAQKLKMEIIQTQEALQIALDLKKWELYIRLIIVTEVQLSQPLVSKDETQSRVDFMYRLLLDTCYPIDLSRSCEKQITKFQNKLESLRNIHLNFEQRDGTSLAHQANISLFPSQMILEHLIQVNLEKMQQNQEPSTIKSILKHDGSSSSTWPLWHIDFFFRDDKLIEYLKADPNLQQSLTPEASLSLTYYYLKLQRQQLGASEVSSIDRMRLKASKPDLMRIANDIKASITDEMLFAKEYYAVLNQLVAELEKISKQ